MSKRRATSQKADGSLPNKRRSQARTFTSTATIEFEDILEILEVSRVVQERRRVEESVVIEAVSFPGMSGRNESCSSLSTYADTVATMEDSVGEDDDIWLSALASVADELPEVEDERSSITSLTNDTDSQRPSSPRRSDGPIAMITYPLIL